MNSASGMRLSSPLILLAAGPSSISGGISTGGARVGAGPPSIAPPIGGGGGGAISGGNPNAGVGCKQDLSSQNKIFTSV